MEKRRRNCALILWNNLVRLWWDWIPDKSQGSALVTGVGSPYSSRESEVRFERVSQGQMHLKQNNNVLSHLCTQLCFLWLSGHRVLHSMRSPWEYLCSLTLASWISLGYPSPSCSNSSPPPFPTAALASLASVSPPPTYVFTAVGSRLVLRKDCLWYHPR